MIDTVNKIFNNIKPMILDELANELMINEDLLLSKFNNQSINKKKNQKEIIHDLLILIYFDLMTELEYYKTHFWTRFPSVVYCDHLIKTHIEVKTRIEIYRLLKRTLLSHKGPIYLISISKKFISDLQELQLYERRYSAPSQDSISPKIAIEVGGQGDGIDIVSKKISPMVDHTNLNLLIHRAIIHSPKNFEIIGPTIRGTLPRDLDSIEVIGLLRNDIHSIIDGL